MSVLCSIAAGNIEQIQLVLNTGVLNIIERVLSYPENVVKTYAIWFLSNITNNGGNQVQAVIDANLVPLLINLLDCEDSQIQIGSVSVISNIILCGTAGHVIYIIDCNIIPSFCKLFNTCDTKIIQIILNGLNNILKKAGERTSEVCKRIEECGGLDKIKHIKNYYSGDICKLADDIIVNFFPSHSAKHDGDNLLSNNIQNEAERNSDSDAFLSADKIVKGGLQITSLFTSRTVNSEENQNNCKSIPGLP